MRVARFVPLLPILALMAACATQPARRSVPEVSLVQVSPLPNARVESASGLPVQYQLKISNPSDQPVKLMSVEVESVGYSGAYEMKRVRHVFDRTIPAKSTATIELRAWVQPLQADTSGRVNSPVMLRGSARFES
ncbi:MAG TPA: hypothetical protein VMS98_14295, partial [Thermoanaerobaculia bacterium]|nr:hypothetical protein [Thermoanaerobaculia bacterium]